MSKTVVKITDEKLQEMNRERWFEETYGEMRRILIMAGILDIDSDEIMNKMIGSKSDEERIEIVKKMIEDKKKR